LHLLKVFGLKLQCTKCYTASAQTLQELQWPEVSSN